MTTPGPAIFAAVCQKHIDAIMINELPDANEDLGLDMAGRREQRVPNFLSGLALDRACHLREDQARLEAIWASDEARVLPVWRSKHFVLPGETPEIAFVSREQVSDSLRVLLGTSSEGTYFAVDLSHLEEPVSVLGLHGSHTVVGLREIAPLVSREHGALLAYANGMMSWHRRHRFCGSCGSTTAATQGGHVRACENEACGQLVFPRTDPAVIMLVTHEKRCLLGRQASWPPRVYSTLAGFVEPGESLEEAVAREVREETGIEVEDVRYHSSQPWPFPSSLMLGFTAKARTHEILAHSAELEDARWLTREEIREQSAIELPSKISIARRLIEDWLGVKA